MVDAVQDRGTHDPGAGRRAADLANTFDLHPYQIVNAKLGWEGERFKVYAFGRNIFNEPDIVYSNVESRVQQYTIYGSMWNLGVKFTF